MRRGDSYIERWRNDTQVLHITRQMVNNLYSRCAGIQKNRMSDFNELDSSFPNPLLCFAIELGSALKQGFPVRRRDFRNTPSPDNFAFPSLLQLA